MHNYEQGFLSEPFDDVRKAVREKYPMWSDLLRKVNAESVTTQYSLEIHKESLVEVLSAVLYARTLSSTQAAVLLLEHGLVSQAKCVLRSSLETLFMLGAISFNPDVAQEIVDSHGADKRTIADRMKRWSSPELRRRVEEGITNEELDELLSSKGKSISVFSMAQSAGMEEWYLAHYSLLSFPAHNSPSDLIRHIVKDGQGGVEEIKNEPEIDEQESAWSYAIEIQIMAASILARIFGSIPFRIEAQRAALTALSESGG